MSYDYVIFGAGRQGCAVGYDLAKNGEAARITLVDSEVEAANRAVSRLYKLFPDSGCEFFAVGADVAGHNEVKAAIVDADAAISAVPYRYNVRLTEAAVEAKVNFCDLGGNTQIVREQLAMHEKAKEAGISIIPDCGLAPGLGNHLAAHGIGSLDEPAHVHIRCGGLPVEDKGPLGYKLLFNIGGLINEYSGHGEFLRDGERVEIPALTELEEIEFPPPVGKCEAAVTSGGTSTAPETYAGRLQTYDYKTVRYPGHFAIVRAMSELGFFEEQVELPDGSAIAPVETTRRLLEEKLKYPDVDDIVVLRVTVSGRHRGEPRALQYDLFDMRDEETGFSAMERATGFPAALVAYMQARKIIELGARPLEISVPAKRFYDELPGHGIQVNLREIQGIHNP